MSEVRSAQVLEGLGGEGLGQVTVVLREGGRDRVTGPSLGGQSPGAAQSFPG